MDIRFVFVTKDVVERLKRINIFKGLQKLKYAGHLIKDWEMAKPGEECVG